MNSQVHHSTDFREKPFDRQKLTCQLIIILRPASPSQRSSSPRWSGPATIERNDSWFSAC